MFQALRDVAAAHHFTALSLIDLRRRSGHSTSHPEAGEWRNPSRSGRQLIAGCSFAVPGVVAGLLLGLLPPPALDVLLALLGAMIGVALGVWMEGN
jgi:hypothetical protein